MTFPLHQVKSIAFNKGKSPPQMLILYELTNSMLFKMLNLQHYICKRNTAS